MALESGDATYAQLHLDRITCDWQRCVFMAVPLIYAPTILCSLTVYMVGGTMCCTLECCRFEGKLEVGNITADPAARLALTFSGAGALLVDVVSLLPVENVERAAASGAMNPWPFRADLLQMLKHLQPRPAMHRCSMAVTASTWT